METRLFVGNLSYQTAENDLQDYFSQFGSVASVSMMMDKFTGKSRGFAFVEFSTPEEAQKAAEACHGQVFQGRALTVNIARPREERAPRREGGGGGGGYRGGGSSGGGGYRGGGGGGSGGGHRERGDRNRDGGGHRDGGGRERY